MDSIPAVVPPLPRQRSWKKNIAPAMAFDWLRDGWRDFTIDPAASISYGLLVFLVSVITVVGIFAMRRDYILLPAFAGFMVVGPIIGIGLYEKSRRLAEGRPVSLWQMVFVKPESGGQILFAGVLLVLLTLLWMRAAVILYALFFGLRPFPGLDHIIPMLFTTDVGWAMLVVGSAVGGLFAAFAFAISAFSIPMLLAERTDALTAMGTSMALVWHNLPVMLTWAAIMLVLIVIGIATGLLGMIVIFPGARTWKLARVPDDAALRPRGILEFWPMSCCAPGAELAAMPPRVRGSDEEVLMASRVVADGVRQTDLSVPGIHCGGCIRTIEKALGGLAGVESARANLSTKRVTVRWQANGGPPPFVETLKQAGFEAHLFDVEADRDDGVQSELIRALAVAGFASSNIMLLSVSIWSGADADTRNLFHWLSLIIALPALAYSGRIFFRSAWRALAHGRTNMDVPISLGVLLAFGMSVYETVQHGPHAYFDAAISLLFFLLIGRTLDHVMRERARLAVREPGAARAARRLRGAGGWHAGLSSRRGDRARHDRYARRR